MATQAKRATLEDWLNFPDDVRCELIDGEILMSPAPTVRHQRIAKRVFLVLNLFVEQHRLGEVFFAPTGVRLGEDGVEPDVIVILDMSQIGERLIEGPPAIVVEVISDSRRDRVLKRRVYERAGVPEYWALDPEADWVEVCRLIDGRYGPPEIVEPLMLLTSAILPGLEIDLTALFARP